jgi:hypothetical protein
MKVGLITFLTPGLESCIVLARSCRRNKLQGGVGFDNHYLAKRINEAFQVTYKTTRTRVYDNQDIKECAWSE